MLIFLYLKYESRRYLLQEIKRSVAGTVRKRTGRRTLLLDRSYSPSGSLYCRNSSLTDRLVLKRSSDRKSKVSAKKWDVEESSGSILPLHYLDVAL